MQTPEQIEDFLKKVQVGVLSTVDTRGNPHAVPMWCLYEDGEFVMSTGLGSQKHKNIQNNENVMLVFDQRETPYYAVMVRGHRPPRDGTFVRAYSAHCPGVPGRRESKQISDWAPS